MDICQLGERQRWHRGSARRNRSQRLRASLTPRRPLPCATNSTARGGYGTDDGAHRRQQRLRRVRGRGHRRRWCTSRLARRARARSGDLRRSRSRAGVLCGHPGRARAAWRCARVLVVHARRVELARLGGPQRNSSRAAPRGECGGLRPELVDFRTEPHHGVAGGRGRRVPRRRRSDPIQVPPW